MQNPQTILNLLNRVSKEKKIISKLYKHLYNIDLYKFAYKQLSNNDISQNIEHRIVNIITEVKNEKYIWTKTISKNVSFNKLTISEWRDTLFQHVIYLLLREIFKVRLLDTCYIGHNKFNIEYALKSVYDKGRACEFFIYGMFNFIINSNIVINSLSLVIKDNRFLMLIKKLLSYKHDDNVYKPLLELLINISFMELDSYIHDSYYDKYNVGVDRPINRMYKKIAGNIYYRTKMLKKRFDKKDFEIRKDLYKKLRLLPSKESIENCSFRRFSYIRVDNEIIICFTGTFAESLQIRDSVVQLYKDKFKQDINLSIVNSSNQKNPARFLNYNIITQWSNTRIRNNQRSVCGDIAFLIPNDVLVMEKKPYVLNKRPIHLTKYVNLSIDTIIRIYQLEYSRICNYYRFARNRNVLSSLKWVIETSLVKTLSRKLQISVTKVYSKFYTVKEVNGFAYKVIMFNNEYFGAIPLTIQKFH